MNNAITMPIAVRVLLFAHFDEALDALCAQACPCRDDKWHEVLPLANDAAVGEALLFYRAYCEGGWCTYSADGRPVFFNPDTGVMLCIGVAGKVGSAMTLTALLMDVRFDMTQALIMGIGCAGGSVGVATLGDVCIETAAVDYDLGHKADIRDMADRHAQSTWFHEACTDSTSHKQANRRLTTWAMDVCKDCLLVTTPIARAALARNFESAPWAMRNPQVLLGTAVSGDDFWKGAHAHNNALEICYHYQCDDPYTVSEMEDVALMCVAERFGLLDHFLGVRVVVNMDEFLDAEMPESLWGGDLSYVWLVQDENPETLDIFEPAMRNLFTVGSRLIDAFEAHTLE